MNYKLVSIILFGLVILKSSYAVELELTQGQSKALPIALVNFKGDADFHISKIIKKDLSHSGAFQFVNFNEKHKPSNALATNFSYWKSLGVNNLIVGDIIESGNQISINFQLLDPISKAHIMISREYRVSKLNVSSLAHHISDLIYQQLTGHKGIFSTRLAYIVVDRKIPSKTKYNLMISDYDGSDPKQLLVSFEPIMSPSWSSKGQKIAYVSFENRKAEIYIVNVSNGVRQLITSFPGINGAPTWSPNNKQLSLVLSHSGSPKIYLYNLASKSLVKLTHGSSIDTEPSFTKNGKNIIFTSNRGGSPQIYKLNLATKKVKRLSYSGSYNASASMLPSGKKLALLHRNSNRTFSIALQELSSGIITPLTFAKVDESPSLAPNGKMLVYATKIKGKGRLRITTLDGKINFKLPGISNANMQEPSWSPYLN